MGLQDTCRPHLASLERQPCDRMAEGTLDQHDHPRWRGLLVAADNEAKANTAAKARAHDLLRSLIKNADRANLVSPRPTVELKASSAGPAFTETSV
jgi:hypothetical protein